MPAAVISKAVAKFTGADQPDYISTLVYGFSQKYRLDPKIVACIIYQESGGDPWAYRDEDEWYDRNLKNKKREQLSGYVPNFPPSLASEKRSRARSFGLMQILGETARSVLGYDGRWLPRISEPSLNVELGCKLLRILYDKNSTIPEEENRLTEVLRRYNGSADYPPIIRKHLSEGKWRYILL